jgi:hypothetical protein
MCYFLKKLVKVPQINDVAEPEEHRLDTVFDCGVKTITIHVLKWKYHQF